MQPAESGDENGMGAIHQALKIPRALRGTPSVALGTTGRGDHLP